MFPNSGPPASGPGFGSSVPGAPPPQQTKKGSGPMVPILAGVCALLLIAAGVFGFLYFKKSSDSSAEIAKLEKENSGYQDTIADQESSVESLESEKEKLENDLSAAEAQADDIEGLQQCLDDVKTFLDAVGDGEKDSKVKDLAQQADASCVGYW